MEEDESADLIKKSGSVYLNLSAIMDDCITEKTDYKTIVRIGENEFYSVKLIIGDNCDTTDQDSYKNLENDSLDKDLLTAQCCDFFHKRRQRIKNLENREDSSTLGQKMETLKSEIASLVSQDDALFRQLLHLHASISDLRQSLSSHNANPHSGTGSGSTSCSRSSSFTSVTSSSTSGDSPPPRRNRVKSFQDSLAWSSSSSSTEEDSRSFDADVLARPPELIPRARLKTSVCRVPSTVSMHKRQRSYDSGILGSDPSDGEVFV